MNPIGAPRPKSPSIPRVDAQELILCDNPHYVCETYIFEPSSGEEKLGYLFAAAEVEDRGGVGKELVDVVIAAIQNEYFRDPSRSAVHSFELALHQANLILHDASERGVRDWMGYIHIAIGAMAEKQLHVSVAGEGNVWLARQSMVSCISEGLSHLPITNPLRTFSQVASGDIATRDIVLLATGSFPALFRPQDISRFTIDHSAETVTSRLEQLYRDQKQKAPVALVTVSLLPDYVMQPKEEAGANFKPRASAAVSSDQLKPRKPLVINRSFWQRAGYMLSQAFKALSKWVQSKLWPVMQRGGVAVAGKVSQGSSKLMAAAGQRSQQLAQSAGTSLRSAVASQERPRLSLQSTRMPSFSSVKSITTWPQRFVRFISNLPATSKVFGVVAIVLLIVLVISLQLLQHKRAGDDKIQRAAEMLHEAQTKKDAASTALIYNNRDQAQTLLGQAKDVGDQVAATGFYAQEVAQLRKDIQIQQDRLQKISRLSPDMLHVVGDFVSALGKTVPTNLFFIDTSLFTFNPSTNVVLAMDTNGAVSTVSQQTKEIGFFRDGAASTADKTILFSTSDPGLALFDSKDKSLRRQDITLGAGATTVGPMSIFGNRLYVFDQGSNNILSYNKTLRGFAGGTPWITDGNFPASSIKALTVDGSIYTLHTDGSIRRLFKGAGADFTVDPVDPPLSSATKIFTTADLGNVYILDPSKQRVIIFTKKGSLVKQIFFSENSALKDFAVDTKETTLYVLDGSKVVSVSLIEATPTP